MQYELIDLLTPYDRTEGSHHPKQENWRYEKKKMSLFVNARKFTLKGNISESKNWQESIKMLVLFNVNS
jgi:hypothetical protein